MDYRKLIEQIQESKNWSFENTNKMDKFLAKLTKNKEKRLNFLKSGMKSGDITIDLAGIKKWMWENAMNNRVPTN